MPGKALVTILAVTLPVVAFDGQDRRVVRVSAERFAFTPSRIEVDAGEEVELRIKSDDTAHGFRIHGAEISGREINLTVPKRGRGEVVESQRLDKPGRYAFECSRMCGAGHNFMRGELVVRERPIAGAGPRVPR
jgi:cytochrome c oxidase subunit 2